MIVLTLFSLGTMLSCKYEKTSKNDLTSEEIGEVESKTSTGMTSSYENENKDDSSEDVSDSNLNSSTKDTLNTYANTNDKVSKKSISETKTYSTRKERINANIERVSNELKLNEKQRNQLREYQTWYDSNVLVHDNNAKKTLMKSQGENRIKLIFTDEQYENYVVWNENHPNAWD